MNRIQKFIFVLFIFTTALFAAFIGAKFLNRDMEGPVIICNEETITASIEDTDKDLLNGISALDEVDGDVSDTLIIESVLMNEEKECTVEYAAFDNSNNVSKFSRTVIYEDYHSPHFSISGPLRFVLGNKSQIMQTISADDCIDGNLTNRIKLVKKDSETEYTGVGIYNYEVQVTNSLGDTAILPVSVEFYADSYEERLFRPNIYLTGYAVYIGKGTKFNAKDYLSSVEIGNTLYVFEENINSNTAYNEEKNAALAKMTEAGKQIAGSISCDAVKFQSNVNTKESGVYTVEYSYTTKDGYSGTTQMVVVVE